MAHAEEESTPCCRSLVWAAHRGLLINNTFPGLQLLWHVIKYIHNQSGSIMVSDHFTLLLKCFQWVSILFRLKSQTLTLTYSALHDGFLIHPPFHLWAHSHEQTMHTLNSQCFTFMVPSFWNIVSSDRSRAYLLTSSRSVNLFDEWIYTD